MVAISGNIYHAFGVQCFTDELAHRANRDPVEYLLDLIGPPRTLDFTNVQYPNYGADYKTYPGKPAAYGRSLKWLPTSRVGPERRAERVTGLDSLPIAVS